MLRKSLLVLLALAGFGTAVAVARPAAPDALTAKAARASFTIRAKVARIIDGDTLQARYKGRSDRVRLIGIDTPEVGQCYAAEATVAARKLASGRKVRLVGDSTQATRDKYGRLLAYVILPDGRDLGSELIRAGRGYVYVYDKPFVKLPVYQAAEAAARQGSLGVWGYCQASQQTTSTITTTTSTTTPIATTATSDISITLSTSTTTSTTTSAGGNCAPSYPDVCIPPPPPDLDCGQIPYRNFRVRYDVPLPDPHRFDGDRDGIGCES